MTPTQSSDFTALPDLASRQLGGTVMAASDDFFADKENLIKPEPAVYRPHTFTPKGQEYDGWETRRRFRRTAAADQPDDWAIIRLGAPGVVAGVNVDTAHFLGNFPEKARIEGAGVDGYPDAAELEDADWFELVPASALQGGKDNLFTVDSDRRVTHVRLHMIPDGGIARLRVHGHVVPDPRVLVGVPFDLVSTVNGGTVTDCSDGFFSPPANMLQPGESRFMADGWETARRRDQEHDWAVLKLTCPADPVVAELTTTHYRGNPPDRIALDGINAATAALDDESAWFPLLPETRVLADTTHRFRLPGTHQVTHVRLANHPDGGIGRFRLYGKVSDEAVETLAGQWFARLPRSQAIGVLTAAGIAPDKAAGLSHDSEHPEVIEALRRSLTG